MESELYVTLQFLVCLTMQFHVNLQVAKPQYVLLWCWAAAVGAGLLKTDDLLMSAARLRVSYDIQYETENLELLMDDAAKVTLMQYFGRKCSSLNILCKLYSSLMFCFFMDLCSETRKRKVTRHQCPH